LQPVGGAQDRLSLALETQTIQLEAAFATTRHIRDKN
jgi:hypothetical protein